MQIQEIVSQLEFEAKRHRAQATISDVAAVDHRKAAEMLEMAMTIILSEALAGA